MNKIYKVTSDYDNYHGRSDYYVEEIYLEKDAKLEYNMFKTKKEADEYIMMQEYYRLTD